MASGSEASCATDPNFAIICSFFEKFSSMLNIQQPDIQMLQEWLENSDEVASGLRELHIKLLRKMRKTVHETAWETALAKFCYQYSAQDAWEIERFGYKKSSLKVKLRILTAILEYQFQYNGKFRNKFSNLSAEELRSEPIGRDRLGHSYWLTQDPSCNFRIYQEHLDEEIWQVVASNRLEMEILISRLRGNEVVLPSLVGVIDEDSSSNSCANAAIKPPPPEEQDDSQCSSVGSNSKTKVPNIKIKIDKVENVSIVEKISEIANGKCTLKTDVPEKEAGEVEENDEDDGDDEEESDEDNDGEESEDEDDDCKDQTEAETTATQTVPAKEINGIQPDEVNENNEKATEVILNGKMLNARKIKPLVIVQSKLSIASDEKPSTKKRVLKENTNGESETEQPVAKKNRPTLSDNRRDKKSKYEKLSEDEEGVEDDDDDDNDDEDEEEEDDYENEEEEEAEAEDDADENKEGDADEGDAEVEEDVQTANGKEIITSEEDNIVSDEIVEDVLIVKGDGSGKDCETSSSCFLRSIAIGCEDSGVVVGEAIEEDVIYIYGEGNGSCCLVGNKHDDNGEPDVTIVKNSKSDIIEKTKQIDSGEELVKHGNNKMTIGLTNGEVNADSKQLEKDEDNFEKSNQDTETTLNENKCEIESSLKNVNSASNDSKQQNESDIQPENVEVYENDAGPAESISRNNDESPLIASETVAVNAEEALDANLSKEVTAIVSQSVISGKPNIETLTPKNDSKVCMEVSDIKENSPNKEKEDIVETQPENIIKTIPLDPCQGNSRKRRLSEGKDLREFSDSESDLNSDSAAPPTEEEDDVGGKRPKMRSKVVNSEVRKKLEETRKSNIELKSTSEDENSCVGKTLNKAESPTIDESDPLHIPGKDDILVTKVAEVESAKVASPMLTQTRTTRRTPAGAGTKVVTMSGRGRKKPGKQRYFRKTSEIPALKVEAHVEEETRSDDNHDSEKMPILEPETSVQPDSALKKDTPLHRKPRGRKRDIDASNIIDSQTDTPVRQSRRIAQLKIREEAERRKLEEEALKKMKAEFKKKKKEEKTAKGIAAPTESSENTEEESEAEEGKKFAPKKKGARGWKKSGWSSGPDEPEEEDEYDLHHDRYDSERGSPLFKSDHEFSPESDIEDESQAVPLKRARTVRKEGAEDDGNVNCDESCQKCGKSDHPEWILLCDKCDKGYHCSCLSPVLFIIPEGDWFCPPCQQEQLIASLEKHLIMLDDRVEQMRIREEEAKRMEIEQKLKEEELQAKEKEISSEPTEAPPRSQKNRAERANRRRRPKMRKSFIANDDDESEDDMNDAFRSSGSRSSSYESDSLSKSSSETSDSEANEPIYKLRKRRQVNVSYRLNEYEDLINSAIKEEMEEVAGAGNLGRGKDISTIIEADKEEKLRQRQISSFKEPEELSVVSAEVKEELENGESKDVVGVTKQEANEEEDDDEEIIAPVKCRMKYSLKNARKKGRKLNNLDISSDDDGSDEDFKTSSFESEEDESISVSTASDSSLEMYRKRGKKGRKKDKKGKRPQRRAVRERRKLDDFIVEDSDWSDESPKRTRKIKQKQNWELQDTESEEDLSEQIDSEELCEDTTDSEDSDGCWRPSKRKKTKGKSKSSKTKTTSQFGARGGKQPRKFNRKNSGERSFKAKTKKRSKHETDDSDEEVPRTRGKRFTYLDSFDEESSDDGIKPGVKRPDTPPEEREKFIKKQEEIKRMLAEKNTEAAKVVATPILAPMDSLSTVPLSVIKGAKALDIDYLQRKGELNSEEGDTDFDEDLPDDFDPEAMDEEEIAKMMEEEDFAQQQMKVTSENVRQKRKEGESVHAEIRQHHAVPIHVIREPPVSLLQEPPRKRLPMPTIHPPLSGMPRFLPPGSRPLYEAQSRQMPSSVHLGAHSVIQGRTIGLSSAAPQMVLANPNTPGAVAVPVIAHNTSNDQMKPRGRRKKITPLRDTLQKQQAAAAAAAAAAISTPLTTAGTVPCMQTGKETTIVSEKSAAGPLQLSVAQQPQLYAPPSSTPPSVITRMPQQLSPATRTQQPLHPQPPHRSLRPPFPEQNPRYYSPSNQIGQHRMSIIRHGAPSMTHLTLGPTFASGPPPLRPTSPRMPASVGNTVNRQQSPRHLTSFTPNEQFGATRAPHPNPPHAYRPPLYGTPGYPPAPPQQPTTPMHPNAPDYPAVPASYGPTPPYGSPYFPAPQNIGQTHPTSQSPASSAIPVSSPIPMPPLAPPVVVTASPAVIPPPTIVAAPPTPPVAVVESAIGAPTQQSRPQASVLETFDSKSRSPLLEAETANSPYSNSGNTDDNDEEVCGMRSPTNTTSEFSGLVSYFSSQHDDLNS